jgi:sRNA-binding carbon storage regulator CsrA
MLVLTRKQDQWIDLYKNGEIIAQLCITDLRRNVCRIGVIAPHDVVAIRREVNNKNKESNDATSETHGVS